MDNEIIGSIAIVAVILILAVVLTTLVSKSFDLDKKYIEAGYTRTMLTGSATVHWVKP